MLIRILTLICLLTVSFTQIARSDTILVMVEEDGCVWCARWNSDISAIYPKTTEGKIAPLRRLDIHAKPPVNWTFKRSLNFTPTFVLMIDGVESDRIEGYPGEDFFWGLLGQLLTKAGYDVSG